MLQEPIAETTRFDAKAFWAKIDALGDRIFPDIRDDDLRPDLNDGVSLD